MYIQDFALTNKLATNVMYVSRGIQGYQSPETPIQETVYAYAHRVPMPLGMNREYSHKGIFFYYKE